jgi:hypothetical protein
LALPVASGEKRERKQLAEEEGSNMGSGFFPRKNAAALSWATQFISAVQPIVTSYGLVASDITAFQALTDAYSDSLALCEPGIRTKGNVAAKNQALANLRKRASELSDRIQGTSTVTDQMKIDAGLNVRAQPVVKPVPSVKPGLKVSSIGARLFQLDINDADVTRRRKPQGVVGAAWFSFVGATPPDDVSKWKWEGSSNKRIVQVLVPESVEPGTQVWFTAVWVNAKNEFGPAADPIFAYTQFGGMSTAA